MKVKAASRANGDMWLLYYEDADERPVLFQTREALKAAEHRALTQWACHPFAPLTEYEALRAKLADLEARLATAEGEVVRLNQWADGMTDIALKERATGEAYQRELRDKIADLEARCAELKAALNDAIESIEDWAGYASEYFRQKHGLAEEVARLKALTEGGDHG